jgi:hypothetical protein
VVRALCPGRRLSRPAVREANASLPQGPSLRSEFFCLGPSSLSRPHPPVSQAHGNFTAGPFISRAFAVQAAPRRPARPSRLSLLLLPNAPSTPTPAGPGPPLSRCEGTWYQSSPVAGRILTRDIRLCQQYPAVTLFRSRLVRFVRYGSLVRLGPLTGSDTRPPRRQPSAFWGLRHPRFRQRSSRSAGGDQARSSNGKPPIVGTLTRQDSAASLAAPATRG